MKYTNYFGKQFKVMGQPHLNNECYKIYFNLVCLENRMHGMLILKKKYKREGAPDFYQFDQDIEDIKKQIFKVTTNQHPEVFMMGLLKKSIEYKFS